jgi:hypothetical protein
MATLFSSVGRGGANNKADVCTVQTLLNRHVNKLLIQPLKVDGVAGPKTIGAIEAFQRKVVGLSAPDGRVDPGGRTLQALSGQSASTTSQEVGVVDGAARSTTWPPRPSFPPLVGDAERQRLFGKFDYKPDTSNPPWIHILGNWQQQNIVSVSVDMGPIVGMKTIQFHRLAAPQLRRLWLAWKEAGLLDRVLSYEGGFAPRFIRGSTTHLSNHAYGSAFDINYAWNLLGLTPALLGDKGCVRELVPIANAHGFYWGGHFGGRLDGMHFEIARIV